MHEVADKEARERLPDLLDEVQNGGEIVITRDGRPVARLVGPAHAFDRDRAARAAEGLLSAGAGLSLDGLSIGELIAEGRRF
ncbi:type II toxin-antitoxin system Phd/YefM family antitoxin [Acidisphaera rubrifaciens]|uniref:Antitoxin n=1 Tax=Acidisphaera rubrifaciens HS-AP3 TaxID=1231350 RepID=A0A0D6P5F1_9PROT|nr:type II toxin-antitoxin system prevent-host-death family antitoxin [Acidisphaera rubrifaciens]GAN76571.1 hypothetical protein Asru_0120_03 [Acidisphaera rubrifaciens HS-AP3]